MVHAHTAFFVCLIGCAVNGMACAQPTEMRNLMVKHVMIFKSDKDFPQIHVGDERILSVSPTSSRTAIINALETGNTNVIVVDERGDPISEFEVVVSEPSQSRVRIHNKSSGLLGYLHRVSVRCHLLRLCRRTDHEGTGPRAAEDLNNQFRNYIQRRH
jgi:hypothetical protein